MRGIRFVVAASLAAAFLIGQAGSAAAWTIIGETGLFGPYSFNDTEKTPGGTCGYSQEYPPNSAFFRWMKIRPPIVMAEDRNPESRDRRHITWFWKLQKATWDGTLGPWHTIEMSDKQTAIAYDDEAAHFSPMRIYHSIGVNYDNPYVFRAIVIIQWKKADGTIEGQTKSSIDYYMAKFPWGPYVTGRPFCGGHVTSG